MRPITGVNPPLKQWKKRSSYCDFCRGGCALDILRTRSPKCWKSFHTKGVIFSVPLGATDDVFIECVFEVLRIRSHSESLKFNNNWHETLAHDIAFLHISRRFIQFLFHPYFFTLVCSGTTCLLKKETKLSFLYHMAGKGSCCRCYSSSLAWRLHPLPAGLKTWNFQTGWWKKSGHHQFILVNIPCFTVFYTSQVVEDFFHQQYVDPQTRDSHGLGGTFSKIQQWLESMTYVVTLDGWGLGKFTQEWQTKQWFVKFQWICTFEPQNCSTLKSLKMMGVQSLESSKTVWKRLFQVPVVWHVYDDSWVHMGIYTLHFS